MTSLNLPRQKHRTKSHLPSARRIAWEVLNQIEKSNAWAEELLTARLAEVRLAKKDERLCRELCFGVVKMRGRLDYYVQRFLKNKKMPPARLLNLLRLGIYQLFLLSKVPVHAAVHETVELAKTVVPLAQVKMVNAILREITRSGMPPLPDKRNDPVLYYSICYSLPAYLVKRWLVRFGETAAEAMMAAGNESPPLWVRVNTLRISPTEILLYLTKQGVSVKRGLLPTALCVSPGQRSPGEIPGVSEGWLYFQDQASQMVGWIIDPQAGNTCLDLCSAPGGKATHMAELMQGTGKVWAYDIHPRKLKRVQENAKRLRLHNVFAITELSPGLRADRVLVDAPCSGLGTLRRHAEIRWRIQESDHQRLAQEQMMILEQAACYVKPGGHLIYSTCTTEPEENEQVINAFLSRHQEFELMAGPGRQGYPGDSFWCTDRFFRTFPATPELDGMFAARMRRKV